jgi:transposase
MLVIVAFLSYLRGMAARLVNIDYDTPLILPPNLRDWVPAGHLAHFILDAVQEMDLRRIRVNQRGTGSEQYPPRMLLALLLYSYATGVFSSRRIEQASNDSVPVRMICGDTHPDHDTLCTFRRENKALLQETFVRVLELAQALKFLQVGQITVAVDGSKVLANASKHAAVSYEHAGKTIEQLDLEVKELMAKAEHADSKPLEDGLSIPAEIERRQKRKAKLAAARAEIEARARVRAAADLAAHQAKAAARAAQEEKGQKPRGPEPKEPSAQPKPSDQYNFTDPESRIMKAGNGQHFDALSFPWPHRPSCQWAGRRVFVPPPAQPLRCKSRCQLKLPPPIPPERPQPPRWAPVRHPCCRAAGPGPAPVRAYAKKASSAAHSSPRPPTQRSV